MAKRVDFISIGSNDLIQYVLAVDRNNARVSHLYDSFHPAVIRSLKLVADACRRANCSLSICGEMASHPAAAIFLVAMGFNVLSMNARSILRIDWVIRTIPLETSKALLKDILEMDDAQDIRYHLEVALDEAGLGGLIRAGK